MLGLKEHSSKLQQLSDQMSRVKIPGGGSKACALTATLMKNIIETREYRRVVKHWKRKGKSEEEATEIAFKQILRNMPWRDKMKAQSQTLKMMR